MKNKNRVYYTISCPDKWWCGNRLGWVDTNDLSEVDYRLACTSRTMYNFNKAAKHLNSLETGSILTRFFVKKGKRFMQDYIRS